MTTMTTSNLNENVCGKISEEGFVNNLSKKGITPTTALGELISNSIDSGATQINIVNNGNNIYVMDDGSGMDIQGVNNMFTMYNENHSFSKTNGVSGAGAKFAIYYLCRADKKCTCVNLYTCTENGNLIIVKIPFDDIVSSGKYTNMITYKYATEDEQFTYEKLRTNHGFSLKGTTIRFEYTRLFEDCLKDQFVNPMKCSMDLRLCVIFGKYNVKLSYTDSTNQIFDLKLYNYFGFSTNSYYCGLLIERIELYVDDNGNYLFIWTDTKNVHHVYRGNERISKNMKDITDNELKKYNYLGEFVIKVGMMKDERIFDPESNLDTFKHSTNTIGTYDQQFVDTNNEKDTSQKYFAKTPIYRNGQQIVAVENDGYKHSSARASPINTLKILILRSSLEYYTPSSQCNDMDNVMEIQENKNQHSGNIPRHLKRWIQYFRDEKWKEIYAYFNSHINSNSIPDDESVLSDSYMSTIDDEIGIDMNNDFNEIVAIEEPQPVAIEEPEPFIIEEPQQIIVEEPEPVVIEEPQQIIVEEPQPVAIEREHEKFDIDDMEKRRQKTIEIIQKLSLTISTNDENVLSIDVLNKIEQLL